MMDELIQACEWGLNPYIFFSANVFSPLIYYSHLTPVLVSLILGAYIYLSNRKSLLNRILLFNALSLSVWLLLDLILWATDSIRLVMITWSLVNMVEPMIYAGFLYFAIVFLTGKDISVRTKILISLPLLPTILLAGTNWNIVGFDLTNCDREVVEGPLAFYNYVIEIGYVLWIIGLGFYGVLKKRILGDRVQSLLIILSILVLLLGFALGNITGSFTDDWAVGQYGLFVIPVSIGALSYFVVQARFMAKSQTMAAQVLVIGLLLAVGSILFIQNIQLVRWVTGVTLIFLGILGYILVRNFRLEIEQRKQIEKLAQDLENANGRLKELDHLKSEFLSIATHQLRAPLTAIRGYAANMADGSYGTVPDHLTEPLHVVQESARLMANSIEDYLNVSRIEQGSMKYEKSDFNMSDVARRVIDELSPVAKKRGLTLSISAGEGMHVHADIGKIKQVLTNIVDNSIKYTESGSVMVTVERIENTIRTTIADTGVGISAEEIGKLFTKFTRARDANKVNTTGTGLGLYVAKQLVEGNGGKIWVESEGLGKGSRFIVELPA